MTEHLTQARPSDQVEPDPIIKRRIINPWTWQDDFGFVQAHEIVGSERTVYCAGQTSVDANCAPVHPGDICAQIDLALDNLEIVLQGAGMNLGNVVRLNYYTTDVDAFLQATQHLVARLTSAGCKPASTMLGVQQLAYPELMIELEATAVG